MPASFPLIRLLSIKRGEGLSAVFNETLCDLFWRVLDDQLLAVDQSDDRVWSCFHGLDQFRINEEGFAIWTGENDHGLFLNAGRGFVGVNLAYPRGFSCKEAVKGI